MKPSLSCFRIASLAALVVPLAGCSGGSNPWQITVENQGSAPCSVYVTMDYAGGGAQGNGEAKAENLAAGKKLLLIAGDAASTIRSIKVVLGADEQELKPNAELSPGQRYLIDVTADGKLQAAFEE